MDRGIAAEHAWKRQAPEVAAPLAAWRPDVLGGRRMPAVIFNATLEDTGGRLAIGTTDLADKRGVKNFGSIYGNVVDPSVVTAARLSATFTYVSPAARIDAPVLRTRTYHVVDGGYFDNYGIAS